MYPLAMFSVAAFGLILFNALSIREQPLLRADVSNELDALLAKGDVDGAKAVCEASPCLVANITRAGLVRANPGSYDSEAV